MSGHEIRVDLFRTRVTGKYRWRVWKGSRIVASSSQGYATAVDRDDNLCTVMGGHMAWDQTRDALCLARVTLGGTGRPTPENVPVRKLDG